LFSSAQTASLLVHVINREENMSEPKTPVKNIIDDDDDCMIE
jgi:hypothetical protein